MKKFTLIAIASIIFANEPSAFKAGDIDSPTPYGLTQSEKKIVEQNKNIQNISRTLFDSNQTQTELRNELDGIKSLLGSIGEKQQNYIDKIDSDKNGSLKDLNTKVEALNKKLEDNFKLQNENYDKIMSTLSEMAKIIDDITQNFVSKEQLKLNLGKNYKELKYQQTPKAGDTNITKSEVVNEKKQEVNSTQAINQEQNSTKVKTEQKQLSPEETFKQAEKLYKSNKLPEAKALLITIADKTFSRKATTQFYLGEIEYKNGDYKAALGYFQDSINSDEKSSFIPLMLYHSAASLEKLDRKQDAKKVLDTLIKTYPKHYLIPSAKKRLTDLN